MAIYHVTEKWLKENGYVPYTGYDPKETRTIVSFKIDGVLKYYLKPKKKVIDLECDCGAKHTSHPNLHSDWCKINSKEGGDLEDDFSYFNFE